MVWPFVFKVSLYCAVPSLASVEVSISDYFDCLRTGTLVTLKRDLP